MAAPMTSGWLQLNSTASAPSASAASTAAAGVSPERSRGAAGSAPSSWRVKEIHSGLADSASAAFAAACASAMELVVSTSQRSI